MEYRNPEQAFDHAIRMNEFSETRISVYGAPRIGYVGDYMYIYTDTGITEYANGPRVETYDYFKNIDTREYCKVLHS